MVDGRIICPDKTLETDDKGQYRAVIQETGKYVDHNEYRSGYMGSYEYFVDYTMFPVNIMVVIFGLIQFVAFLCWNDHYKWFRVELKSCWKDDEYRSPPKPSDDPNTVSN
jgi:hypothetical protein